ncbi:MAG TPA: hypothetical protein VMP68_05830 [Candidatus Eisenbacteria bacterium]|nr:hypothetical protein [Candidatus Eisenbacteria bacterium]
MNISAHAPLPSTVLSRIAAGLLSLLVLSLGFSLSASSAIAQTGYTGIFGGGPFYKNASANITEIENSGFSEAIVWSVEVNSVGDLNFNGEFPLTSGGVYVGNSYYPNFPSDMAQLKQGTVKRVTFSVGSSNYGDWENIAALVKSQGIGPSSILYKDFAALKAAIPALDAIDFDDENSFDSTTTIEFGVMLGQLGYHVMPDPFDNASYWTNVVAQINSHLPGTVDGVHLQAYAGGAGNNPCVGWNFGTVPVFPGLWDLNDTPSQVETIMGGWHAQCGILGGFMWLYDDFVGNGLAAEYANAINTAVSGSGFRLSGPGIVYVNQHATANAKITITDFGGFRGNVTLSVSGLPNDVKAVVQGTGNQQKVVFAAGVTAATGFAPITITGTSGSLTQTLKLTLAVSAGVGSAGKGTPVDLSSSFSVYGIYQDGVTYATGGLDGVGYSYSANLLGTSRVLNGLLFNLGPTNMPDAIPATGQSIAIPTGKYKVLVLIGTGIQGNQLSRTLTVTYTDGSRSHVLQSFSDWYTPQQYSNEYEAVAMPYRNFEDGTKDKRIFNLYAYPYPLNSTKTVQSVTLPNDPNIMVLAVTLVP